MKIIILENITTMTLCLPEILQTPQQQQHVFQQFSEHPNNDTLPSRNSPNTTTTAKRIPAILQTLQQ
jgi:hypothetical protein